MLKFLSVERNAALLLLLSVVAGLMLANGPFGTSFADLIHSPFTVPGASLSIADFVGEFLMTGFFLLVGLELKREFNSGVFQNRMALAIPGLAALFGALIPSAWYVFATWGDKTAVAGWGIPMATDLTFALAVFSIFGRALPQSARTFVLAFAVLDDLIAILVIALFVGSNPNLYWVALAAVSLVAFWWASRINARWMMLLSALVGWYLLFLSGVQPAVLGVALGLLVQSRQVEALETAIHPWVSLGVLPLFAFLSSQVSIGAEFDFGAPVVIGVMLRPLGKFIGILFGAQLGRWLVGSNSFAELRLRHFAALATLGGIGFSVALLIANRTFGYGSELANQAIVATLLAMLVSMVISAVALSAKRR